MSSGSRWGVLLIMSVGGGFLLCIEYLELLTWVLPPTDGAHEIGAFGDPFVLALALMVSTGIALLVWPVAALLWRHRDVAKCSLALFAGMLVSIPVCLLVLRARALFLVPALLVGGIVLLAKYPRGWRDRSLSCSEAGDSVQ